MTESRKKLIADITGELNAKFPGMKPKIAELREQSFIYELEKHENYTYYSVRYSIDQSGKLTVDWGSAELTIYA